MSEEHPFIKYPCIECKFCKVDWADKFLSAIGLYTIDDTDYKCRRTEVSTNIPHPVYGARETRNKLDRPCRYERDPAASNASSSCGLEAKYWKPKSKYGLFKYIEKQGD